MLFVGLIPFSDTPHEAFQEFDPYAWFGTQTKRVFVLDRPSARPRSWPGILYRHFRPPQSRGGPSPRGRHHRNGGPPRGAAHPMTEGSVSNEEINDLKATARQGRASGNAARRSRWTAEASKQVTAFAEKNGIPVITDWRALTVSPATLPSTQARWVMVAPRSLAALRTPICCSSWAAPSPTFRRRASPFARTPMTRQLDRQHRRFLAPALGRGDSSDLASPVAFGQAVADLDLGEHPDWTSWREPAVEAHRKVSQIRTTPAPTRRHR